VNLAVLGTVLLGGVAALDAVPVGQTMLSQPLVTAALLGVLWGDWRTALEVGVVLQLLAASTMPVGSRTPEDYATGGVVGAALAMALAAQQPFAMARESSALLGTLAGMVTATAGVPLIRWQRRRNEGLSRWCEAELRRGRGGALATAQGAGVAFSFAVGVGFVAACLALGLWTLGPLVQRESLRLSRAWTLAQPLWIGLGLAQLISAFIQRRLARAAVFGFGLIAAWLVLIVGGR
jgi:mannose/fructose/N-acetylgalactosamine-specific phosphotransferase system component IIC